MDGTIDYRIVDQNDVTLLDFTVDPRPSSDVPDEVKQTFTVRYKKPFKANEPDDVNLEVGPEFNITSAFGCYNGARPYDSNSLSVETYTCVTE